MESNSEGTTLNSVHVTTPKSETDDVTQSQLEKGTNPILRKKTSINLSTFDPKDPENPRNWPLWKSMFSLLISTQSEELT